MDDLITKLDTHIESLAIGLFKMMRNRNMDVRPMAHFVGSNGTNRVVIAEDGLSEVEFTEACHAVAADLDAVWVARMALGSDGYYRLLVENSINIPRLTKWKVVGDDLTERTEVPVPECFKGCLPQPALAH